MRPLVAGIFECPQCKKIIKEKKEDTKTKVEEAGKGDIQDGEFFHRNASLKDKFEVCEKGITIHRSSTRWIAALIFHSPQIKDEKYVRLSWWKGYQHGGMIKIYDPAVLKNMIEALKKVDLSFDDLWNWKGKFTRNSPKTDEDLEKEKNIEILKYRIIENKTCPKCQKKMSKMKSHYECPHCGEIVILEGYNQPIFNISPDDLDLTFHTNLPINYYMPVSGITIKWLMGEWKAIAVIYSKDNPNKKWLRFYWWVRDLSNIMRYGQREMGDGTKMGWKAQRGVSSPNLYERELVKPLINASEKLSVELNWN